MLPGGRSRLCQSVTDGVPCPSTPASLLQPVAARRSVANREALTNVAGIFKLVHQGDGEVRN